MKYLTMMQSDLFDAKAIIAKYSSSYKKYEPGKVEEEQEQEQDDENVSALEA